MMRADFLAPLFFALALVGAALKAPHPAPPAFVPPPFPISSPLPAEFFAEMLPTAAVSAHAATLAELPGARLAAAWFAGSREGAADVAIWFSRRENGAWTPPRPIATRESTRAATLAPVRKLGNPVLYQAPGGKLHLWFVGVGVGGWAGGSINHAESGDDGDTWSPAEKLVTSPFFNLGTLVRTPPLALADGGLALPVYHELIAKHGECLRLSATGRLLGKERLPAKGPALQPAIAAFDANRALALMRDAGPAPGQILTARTVDGGAHWEDAGALPIGNPNASIALLRLTGGPLLVAANPGDGRHALHLWRSEDEGHHWRLARTVEASADPSAEFSYPALLQTQDGRIHLAYTWQRQGIRHLSFSEDWLSSEEAAKDRAASLQGTRNAKRQSSPDGGTTNAPVDAPVHGKKLPG